VRAKGKTSNTNGATYIVIDTDSYQVERRLDGVILVRVPSARTEGPRLPDAVFSFRRGDPQYEYWERRLQSRDGA
jgi:hypothetical protein